MAVMACMNAISAVKNGSEPVKALRMHSVQRNRQYAVAAQSKPSVQYASFLEQVSVFTIIPPLMMLGPAAFAASIISAFKANK